MLHIHISIVSRHLATTCNNKILRTPPPHISSSEEIFHCITRRTLTQPRTNKPLSQIIFTQCRRQINFITTISYFIHIPTPLSPVDLWTHPAGDICPGLLVPGYLSGGICPEVFVRRYLSGGICPGVFVLIPS